MSVMHIVPYWEDGTWRFDDEEKGVIREPFVGGADSIITKAVEQLKIARAERGFHLRFSDRPFEGAQLRLTWVERTLHMREDELLEGNVYATESGDKGWLCPVLLKYFSVAPTSLFARFDEIV